MTVPRVSKCRRGHRNAGLYCSECGARLGAWGVRLFGWWITFRDGRRRPLYYDERFGGVRYWLLGRYVLTARRTP